MYVWDACWRHTGRIWMVPGRYAIRSRGLVSLMRAIVPGLPMGLVQQLRMRHQSWAHCEHLVIGIECPTTPEHLSG